MNSFPLFLLFSLLSSCAAPAREPAFAPLFPADGTPSGWFVSDWSDLALPAPPGASWTVRGGVLRADGARGSWLVSETVHDDFELEFEIRLTARGNGGVALRVPPRGDPAFDGLELQVADLRYNPEAKPSELTGGLYRALAPRAQVYRPEEWNSVRIRLEGPRLRATLNGVLIHDADLSAETEEVPRHDGSPAPPLRARPRAGRIGFQHLSRDGALEIRNARLRELGFDGRTEDELIWRGRHRAYAGDYEGAVRVYTEALRRFPDSPRLLRHRGHRHLTTRRFDLAERDLARASELIRGRPDEIEPDGIPNAAGIPRSTLNSNVEYHLGLALQLQGRLAEAEAAWRRCVEHARVNDDMLCAALSWLHVCLLRQGRTEDARAAIEEVHGGMDVIENFGYYDLLRLFRGELDPAELLAGHPPGSVEHATRAYGLSVWHEAAGRTESARALRAEILAADPPASFGYLASEAETIPRPIFGGAGGADGL